MHIARSTEDGLRSGTVALLGVPFDGHSSFLQGAALAPPRIREALHSPASNLCAENGLDLGADDRWQDLGDLPAEGAEDAFLATETAIARILNADARPLVLGGDHSITYPILRAYAGRHPHLTILQIDAHPDLYDELDGDRLSHACPFARILEENLAHGLVQMGVRTFTPHQRRQAARFAVQTVEMRHWRPGQTPPLGDGPLYLSLDLDALDPAYAPGVAHHEPGGFSTRELLGILQGLDMPIVGADIVEYNPVRDPLGTTAALAAKLLKEILALMV